MQNFVSHKLSFIHVNISSNLAIKREVLGLEMGLQSLVCSVSINNLILGSLIEKTICGCCHPVVFTSHASALCHSPDSESGMMLESHWEERGGVAFSGVCQKPWGFYLPRISIGDWKGAVRQTNSNTEITLISVSPLLLFRFFSFFGQMMSSSTSAAHSVCVLSWHLYYYVLQLLSKFFCSVSH